MNKGKKVDILFGNDSGAWNPDGKDEIQEKVALSFVLPSLFFFQNLCFWRRQVLSNPRNVCLGAFVITNNWAVACSLRKPAGIHFSSSTVSPCSGSPLLWGGRELTGPMISSPFRCWPIAVQRAAGAQGGKMPRSHRLCNVPLGFHIWPLQKFPQPRLPKLNEAEVAHQVCSVQGIPKE